MEKKKNIRSFLTTADLSTKEIHRIFKKALFLKKHPYSKVLYQKSLAMIFQKPSTRTRVSFEVGITQLGGHALYLGSNDMQLSRGETIADTARVIGRYADIIMARVISHGDVEELSAYANVPVINGLSDLHHPCQAMADLLTILEKKKKLKGLRVSFVGDGDNNVTYSLAMLCAQLGVDMVIASPFEYRMREEKMSAIREAAKRNKSLLVLTTDPLQAVKNADVVYTDIWVSMGREDKVKRMRIFPPYQLNTTLLSYAKNNALVMHDLPAHRGEEITNEVIDGPQSVVWDQAENRLHVQKAIILFLLGKM